MSYQFKRIMKMFLIAFMLTVIPNFFYAVDPLQNNGVDQTRAMSKVITSGVSFNQQIASSSIDNSVTAKTRKGQFWITKSGRYFLSTDVIASPVVNDIPVVFIDTSDVLIDLGGKTLTLTYTAVNTDIVGIKVAPGVRNITICNGTISGSNAEPTAPLTQKPFYAGIVVGDPTGTDNKVCANILLDSVTITSCARRGVEFYNCQNVKVSELTVQGITSIPSVPRHGSHGEHQKICMKADNCKDIEILNSDFNGASLIAETTGGDFAVGLLLKNCRNVYCHDVSASDNKSRGTGSALGVKLVGTSSSKFENLRAVGNYSLSTHASDHMVGGLYIGAHDDVPSIGNIFKDCFFNDNAAHATSITCTGFGVRVTQSCDNNLFIGCTASSNSGVLGVGFDVRESRNNTFRDCIALGNTSELQKGFAQARGFSSIFGVGNSYIHCEARGNTVKDVAVAGRGDAITHPMNVPSAFGFFFRSELYSGIRDCLSASNYGSLTDHAAYGVALYGKCYSCVVSFSEMSANRAAYRYGFKDFAQDCTTLLRGNISFAHGNCYKGGQSSITDSGKLNYMLEYLEVNGNMDVQNLIKEADIANMNAFEAGSAKWFNFSILENAISG